MNLFFLDLFIINNSKKNRYFYYCFFIYLFYYILLIFIILIADHILTLKNVAALSLLFYTILIAFIDLKYKL
jgi:hypothetical protein